MPFGISKNLHLPGMPRASLFNHKGLEAQRCDIFFVNDKGFVTPFWYISIDKILISV
jgi:hypothetical protein